MPTNTAQFTYIYGADNWIYKGVTTVTPYTSDNVSNFTIAIQNALDDLQSHKPADTPILLNTFTISVDFIKESKNP